MSTKSHRGAISTDVWEKGNRTCGNGKHCVRAWPIDVRQTVMIKSSETDFPPFNIYK